MTKGEVHPETKRMMEIAIRRLHALEYVILGVAMVLALVAGWLAAWMVEHLTGAPFRLTWAVLSVLFYVVPGYVVLRRERRANASSMPENGGAAGVAETADAPPSEDIAEKIDDGGRDDRGR